MAASSEAGRLCGYQAPDEGRERARIEAGDQLLDLRRKHSDLDP